MDISRKRRFRAALISIVVSCLVLGMKWYAYLITASTALKSDALESVVNVVAGFFALGAVMYAEQPADEDHPYGHGKIEYFSAAFEGGLISLAAILIIYEAVMNLVAGVPVRNLGVGMWVNLAAGCLNGILGFYLIRAGKKLGSEAIQADGEHILSDFVTTAGILLGLVLMLFTGYSWIDPLIALVVGGVLARTGFLLVRRSSGALLDQQDFNMLDKIVGSLNEPRPPEVIAIHELRTMRSGRHTHADLHLVVPEFYEVRRAHDIVDKYCAGLIQKTQITGEFHTHVDPCMKKYCSHCAVENCPIRVEKFKEVQKYTVKDAMKMGEIEEGER